MRTTSCHVHMYIRRLPMMMHFFPLVPTRKNCAKSVAAGVCMHTSPSRILSSSVYQQHELDRSFSRSSTARHERLWPLFFPSCAPKNVAPFVRSLGNGTKRPNTASNFAIEQRVPGRDPAACICPNVTRHQSCLFLE